MYSVSEFPKLFDLRDPICIRYGVNQMCHYMRAFAGWDLTCQHLRVPVKYYAASSPALQPCHQAAGLAFEYRGPDHHPSYTFKAAKQNVMFSKTIKLLDITVAHIFCMFLTVYCNFPTLELRILLGICMKQGKLYFLPLIVLHYILHSLSSVRIEFQHNCDKGRILNFH